MVQTHVIQQFKKEMAHLEVSLKNAWRGRVKYLQPCHSYQSLCGLPLTKSNDHTVVDEKTQSKEQSWSGCQFQATGGLGRALFLSVNPVPTYDGTVWRVASVYSTGLCTETWPPGKALNIN